MHLNQKIKKFVLRLVCIILYVLVELTLIEMNNFEDLVQHRRSHRSFSEKPISAEYVRLILRAALMSPSSKGSRSWRFIVVDDKIAIEKLSDAKAAGSQFLKSVPLAIVVLGNPDQNDCWIEDGSAAAMSMLYQAEDLGLGACWIEICGRSLSDGTSSDEIVHGILDVSEQERTLCIIALGHATDERKLQDENRLKWENVSIYNGSNHMGI